MHTGVRSKLLKDHLCGTIDLTELINLTEEERERIAAKAYLLDFVAYEIMQCVQDVFRAGCITPEVHLNINNLTQALLNIANAGERIKKCPCLFRTVQEVCIALRWQVLKEENESLTRAKNEGRGYRQEILSNGDTLKQLLVRRCYLLSKHSRLWNPEQKEKATLLFVRYLELEKAYGLATDLGDIYNNCTSKEQAFKHLTLWYNKVEDAAITSFRTVARSIQHHYIDILNFFNNRTTNATAESFNAKIKAFRSQFRGVKDKTFFLYRLAKLYA